MRGGVGPYSTLSFSRAETLGRRGILQMAKPLIGLCDLVSIVSGSSLRWTAIGASARSLPMPFVSIFAFLRELSFFEIRPGMRVEVCPLVGERKPRLKPWPPVSHLLAPGENRCLSEGAASSHSTELMASPFDEAHGKAVLLLSHHTCRWMSSKSIVQIALNNRWLESQGVRDSSSLRA